MRRTRLPHFSLLALLLILALLLAACGGDDTETESTDDTTTEEVTDTDDEAMDDDEASHLAARLTAVTGVAEAVVIVEDGVAYLKVDRKALDEEALEELTATT